MEEKDWLDHVWISNRGVQSCLLRHRLDVRRHLAEHPTDLNLLIRLLLLGARLSSEDLAHVSALWIFNHWLVFTDLRVFA